VLAVVGQLRVEHRLLERAQPEAVGRSHQVDRAAEDDAADDRAVDQQPAQRGGPEPGES